MYPCHDCIHKCGCALCSKTKIHIAESRHNERLCGEAAHFFSPRFSSIKLHAWEREERFKTKK